LKGSVGSSPIDKLVSVDVSRTYSVSGDYILEFVEGSTSLFAGGDGYSLREFYQTEVPTTPASAADESLQVLRALWRKKRAARLRLRSSIGLTEIEIPEDVVSRELDAGEGTHPPAAASEI
jgi:hypothetical protein